MAANDIYELNADLTYAGQALNNTFHFRQEGTDGTGDGRTGCMDMFIEDLQTEYLNCMVDEVNLVQLRCRKIKPTETQSLITAVGSTGTIITEGYPPQTAAILREHAEPLLRRGTGHIKLSGVPIAGAINGRLDAAHLALLTLLGAKLKQNQTDSTSGFTFRAGVYSLVDSIIRDILVTVSTPRLKTVYSRSVGVGA